MTDVIVELLKLLLINTIFLGVCILAILPLAAYRKAAFAILKRNFVGYFMNPTGYVFLCLFVVLSSLAAFWPHEFFSANLASLHQLNLYLPYIMLVFIPAITMSIWSEERRQGTDELLLTLPADDFDVVIGKYLAAAAVYTFSLLFAQISHYLILVQLTFGALDTGLLCSAYFGYWLTGLAMISIGMIASFLTRNLTVGFILGAIFNAPLVFFAFADVIIPLNQVSHMISMWSISAKFDDFGRGVISLSSVTYFVSIIVVGLYISMALIGSRHWWGGRDGTSLIGHLAARTLSLVMLSVSLVVLFSYHDLRKDVSEGRVSSLSPDTMRLLRNLDPEHTIYVDAFISARIPQQHMQTQYDLKTLLKEFASRSSKIRVRIHDNLEPFDEQAVLAEQRFGITPRPIRSMSRGAIRDDEVILGAAFSSGLEKVTIPFFERGVPVEYELIRSINTVAKQRRLKLGIVQTDAQLFATPSFQGGNFQTIPQQMIIDELEKQYDVEQVDPLNRTALTQYDVLLAVQPSSMDPEGLDNLLAVIKAGQPTAIFEDPLPIFISAPGTGDPRRSPAMMMGMPGGQAPPPKGDIRKLWDAIGIDVPSSPTGVMGVQPHLAWQTFNPYPKLQQLGDIPDTWVFASVDAPGGEDALNQSHEITSSLRELLLISPGAITEKRNNPFDFTPLVATGSQAGTIELQQYQENIRNPMMLRLLQEPSGRQILGAYITGGEATAPDLLGEEEDDEIEELAAQNTEGIKVIYVADIDLMMSAFLQIRANPGEDAGEIQWNFENVTFILNAIDYLSGETDYVAIRKHRPVHYTLRQVEDRVQEALNEEMEQQIRFRNEYERAIAEAEAETQKAVEEFSRRRDDLTRRRREGEDVGLAEVQGILSRLQEQQEVAQRRFEKRQRDLERDRDQKMKTIRRNKELRIDAIQNTYKVYALLIPPIPPMLIGLIVFARRRLREREGISRNRLV